MGNCFSITHLPIKNPYFEIFFLLYRAVLLKLRGLNQMLPVPAQLHYFSWNLVCIPSNFYERSEGLVFITFLCFPSLLYNNAYNITSSFMWQSYPYYFNCCFPELSTTDWLLIASWSFYFLYSLSLLCCSASAQVI